MCYGCVMLYCKEGRWVKEQRGRRSMQLIDDLLEKKNYINLKRQLKTGAFGDQ